MQPREYSMLRRRRLDWMRLQSSPERGDSMISLTWRLAASALLIALNPPLALAQDAPWPTKPVRLIVPGGTAGVVDIRARWLAARLAPAPCPPLVVENRPGAGGNIGTEVAAHSAPDGYTLVMVHQGSMAINPHLYSQLGYDALADFATIQRLGFGPLMLAVAHDFPAQSVADLVRLAKASPGKLSYGSPGIGTPPHIASELFTRMAGIEAIHVPYKGGGQAVSDLIAGHLSFSIEGLNVQLPYVKSGRLRALAVTSAQRHPAVPDIPTLAESGVPGYLFIGGVGVPPPAATPAPIIAKLYGAIAKVLESAE